MLLCISSGCSRTEVPASLYDAAGEVFVNEKPLESGTITFEPADGKGSVYSGQIQAGHFSVKTSAGQKRVSLTASRPSKNLGPDGKPMSEQYLPARYNAKTKLTAEVSPDGANAFEFKIKVEK
tara:strand:+ start:765 stop:1133 length:369 start_codon:yes stop_codon:yes gene_type:complete